MEQKSSKRKNFICLCFSWNDLLVYVAYDNSGLAPLSKTRKSTLSCLNLCGKQGRILPKIYEASECRDDRSFRKIQNISK